MVSAEHARTIVGIIGNVISFCLFLSPVPTFYDIIRKKSVQQFQVYPYLATVLNCALWVFYGQPYVHPDSKLVVTINGIGLGIEIVYLSIYFLYADWQKRRKALLLLLVELVFLGALITVTLLCVHGTKRRTLIIGIVCIVFNVLMYSSPLFVFWQVITTKSVKYMPFFLSLAGVVNAAIWLAYSLIKFDINLLIPNGLGTLFGIIQLILYASFYKTTNWNEDDDNGNVKKPSGIELPTSKTAEHQV